MPQSSGSAVASFVGPDTVSQGNWQGKYGTDGYSIANGSQSLPPYASFAPLNQSNWTWSSNTTDPRALQTIPAGRMAATWFSSSTFSLDVNLTDGQSHQIAIYAVDWDDYMGGRAETIQVADANSNAVLDTRNISSFTNGMYLVWNISGHVRINATMNAGGNAVISGIFFGGAMSSAPAAISSFVGLDTATEGSWQGKYGADGYSIANSSQSLPSYASFATMSQSNYTWIANTTDLRALQTIPAGRIAATWFSCSTFSLDVNLTDGKSHQIAIYAVDWDDYMGGRAETIQVADANSNAVLDTRNISSFTDGMYLVWNVTGHVRISATMNAGGNAVISGIFFGGVASNPPSTGTAQISVSPTAVNMGSVNVGSATSQTIAITNSGTAALTITQIASTGTGYSVANPSLPVTLAPGQTTSATAAFTPASVGAFSGGITFTSNASGSPTTIPVTATGVGIAPAITTQPIGETVTAGQPATFFVADTGTAPLSYQWKKNGAAISGATASSYTTPATAASDNASQFSVVVTNGMGSVASNTAVLTVNSPTLILNASASSLAFGSVNVSASGVQTVTLTNAGTGNVTISTVSLSGPGFSVSGVSSGTILSPGQSATLNATFAPATSGSVTGSISIGSSATAGTKVIALSGTGAAQVAHSVMLSWTPSTSTVVGYNVYVSTVSGSSYSKLTATPVATAGYTDAGLQTAQTRYYVVTSVDSNNNESAFSNEASALVP